jgi:hypothetical protein
VQATKNNRTNVYRAYICFLFRPRCHAKSLNARFQYIPQLCRRSFRAKRRDRLGEFLITAEIAYAHNIIHVEIDGT